MLLTVYRQRDPGESGGRAGSGNSGELMITTRSPQGRGGGDEGQLPVCPNPPSGGNSRLGKFRRWDNMELTYCTRSYFPWNAMAEYVYVVRSSIITKCVFNRWISIQPWLLQYHHSFYVVVVVGNLWNHSFVHFFFFSVYSCLVVVLVWRFLFFCVCARNSMPKVKKTLCGDVSTSWTSTASNNWPCGLIILF